MLMLEGQGMEMVRVTPLRTVASSA